MIALSLAEVAAATRGRLADCAGVDPAALVTSVVIDSRQVAPGSLFVALPGERVDGHDFAAAAVGSGALAVLAARPVGVPAVIVTDPAVGLAALAASVRDRYTATVIGVTGSAGKTTTKDLLADLLGGPDGDSAADGSGGPGGLGATVAAVGSFNNEIGLPLTMLRAEPETRFVVLEMGARGIGHIATLCALARPQVGLVLNVGSAHVGEYADGRRGIAVAKGELAEAASELVVLNADDPLVAPMAARVQASAKVMLFGTGAGADVRAERIEVDAAGRAAFDLLASGERHRLRLGLIGAHQVANALAAAAAAIGLGLAPADAAAALERARPRSRWRMEVTTTPGGVVVLNDAYNANPESMRAALAALLDIRGDGRAWAVLGPMGELGAGAAEAHRDLGRLVASLGVPRLVAVGPGALGVHEAAREDVGWAGESTWVPGVDEAVAFLGGQVRPGDVVLVKASRSFGLEAVAAGLAAGPVTGSGAGQEDRKDGVAGAAIEGTEYTWNTVGHSGEPGTRG
ncbi:UDP-N-acetylmuramoyl-tripeptide--D-alanyl-D-alanine ligase [Parafrankia irregularis]|uniref:UDP-N-acetylmuramoyl-tripeptide--D-alanyl-D-alanine ligase n=1 Tax=Parafrankia irregularis TaxID=795642 RepID=A0A0S4QXH8_9ACTN|nr:MULTISPECIES: UDP-N-acetylmuramoyl-tripeptide--D-alanyl-D-alanine ligase [Parafrankia]MBE3201963.1 UDP-N-acetylmuramoyl-tripeptide--D-alanyl-D-alanine ligase [Parafrankia sp. CH37]CUU59448.1 UDP-N-acetylmuramoyl-tripeptide--D-alanyl-D-alanine ligase [Parafrankia irregularis]